MNGVISQRGGPAVNTGLIFHSVDDTTAAMPSPIPSPAPAPPTLLTRALSHGFSTVLAASSPLLANASVGRRGGMGMEPAYPAILATHLCDNRRIRPVQVGRARRAALA